MECIIIIQKFVGLDQMVYTNAFNTGKTNM